MALAVPRWVGPLAVFGAAFALYSLSFDGWFAVLDFNHLEAARHTDASTFFLRVLDPSDGGRTVIKTGDLYRPVYYSAMWLEYQAFGLDAQPYYVLNATLHATNAALVWLLAWRLTRSGVAAFAGAFIWTFHPQYADAVAWISSITDLLLVLFSLSAVLLYMYALDASGRRRWLLVAASVAATLLAIGSKESGIAVVPIIGAYHLLVGHPGWLRERELPWTLAPYAAIAVTYFPLRAALVGNLATQEGTTQLGPEFFANIHALTGLLAGPFVGQGISNVDYGIAQGALGIAIIAATVAALAFGSNRDRFLVAWYYLALGPYLVLAHQWLIGRYFYLGFAGLAILAGIGVAKAIEWLPKAPPQAKPLALAVALAGVALWFGALNADYQSWHTDKGDDARAFIAALQAVYPELPEGARLIVTEYPRTLSFYPDDGLMLRPAVRLAYGRDVVVLTLSEIESGAVEPPRASDVWYPPRAVVGR